MRALNELAEIAPQQIWEGVTARIVQGERITMAINELEPNGLVPEHQHENEQLGFVITGSVTFRVGDDSRELGPGGSWRILSNVPHEARAGAHGAIVVDVFTPVRSDWEEIEPEPPRAPRWPV